MFAPIPAKLTPNRETKPYRTGAYVLTTNENGEENPWFYTANPHLYREDGKTQQNCPFYQTPEHMKVHD